MDDEHADPLLMPPSFGRAGDIFPMAPSRRAQLVREIGHARLEVERAMLRANSGQYMGLKLLKSAMDAAHQVLASSPK